MDADLQRLASEFRCTYTRYADDMTFSFDDEPFPEEIARYPIASGTSQVVIGVRLRSLIQQHGFNMNYGKSRLQVSWSHQEVTGLTVNKMVNVRRSYMKNLRAILHDWKTRGYEDAQQRYRELKGDLKKNNHIDLRNAVKGRLNHVKMIRGENNLLYRRYLDEYNTLTRLN
jgi:RNA-directed DNA polymerase